jgi:hypothetical protein
MLDNDNDQIDDPAYVAKSFSRQFKFAENPRKSFFLSFENARVPSLYEICQEFLIENNMISHEDDYSNLNELQCSKIGIVFFKFDAPKGKARIISDRYCLTRHDGGYYGCYRVHDDFV